MGVIEFFHVCDNDAKDYILWCNLWEYCYSTSNNMPFGIYIFHTICNTILLETMAHGGDMEESLEGLCVEDKSRIYGTEIVTFGIFYFGLETSCKPSPINDYFLTKGDMNLDEVDIPLEHEIMTNFLVCDSGLLYSFYHVMLAKRISLKAYTFHGASHFELMVMGEHETMRA